MTASPTRSRSSRRRIFGQLLLALLLAALITPLAALLSRRVEFFRSYELESLDWRLRCCGRRLDPSDVAVVRLNLPTLERNPEAGWPIPRREYAAFIDGMMEAGARVVALDLLFVYPDKNGPENDRILAETLERHPGRVVLGMAFNIHGEDNPEYIWGTPRGEIIPYVAREAYFPLESLARNAAVGHLTVVPDLDGVTRRMPLLISGEGRMTPSLSLAAAMVFRGIPQGDFRIDGSRIVAGTGPSALRLPVDERGCLVPKALYRGHERGPRYAFSEAMKALDRGDRTIDGETFETAFGGKIVLVGMGDIVEDKATTPWNSNAEGVDIHAAFTETILGNQEARSIGLSGELLVVFLLGAGVGLCALRLAIPQATGALLGFIAGYLILTVLALSLRGVILPVIAPTLGVAMYAVPILFRRIILGERWRTAEKEEIRKAMAAQRMLLPREKPDLAGVDLHGSLNACLEVAGDSYDYFLMGDDHLALSVGDVAGKGLSAAILMSNIQGRLRTEAEHRRSPAEIFQAVNNACALVLEPTAYATLALAVLNTKDRSITSCVAGHCPPLVVRQSGPIEALPTGGFPIGMFGQAAYSDERVVLEGGDTVVFYTDGITEASDPSGHFYGEERLKRALEQCAGLGAEAVAGRILDDVEAFTRGAPATDDRTLLVVRIL